MKSLVYDMLINSEMDLVVQISIAVTTILEMSGIFEQVLQSMSERVVHEYMPMAAIWNTFYDAFYLIYYCFLCNKAFYTTFCIVALLSLSRQDYVSTHAFLCNYGCSGCSLPPLQVCTRHLGSPCTIVQST
ncbi:hypothetical protein TNCV_1812791 [Trichonephila clavipes]|uniref:Uncharacterized protein n=1 Tax=Trichonephila clavipes TaxID=2585209 RepID=A0A8X7BFR6_TRICX|nr:hypothetical protein TNCV_1812791 [Trichonephila clavipes]